MIYCETFDNGDIQYTNEDGELHREDGPAIIESDGNEFWYLNGVLHRDKGPAVILQDGTLEWFKNGVRHNENGPALIRFEDISSTKSFDILSWSDDYNVSLDVLSNAFNERKMLFKYFLNGVELQKMEYETLTLNQNLTEPKQNKQFKM